jgi:hypothetical protein
MRIHADPHPKPCNNGYEFSWKDSVDSGLGEYVTIHITPEPEFSYVSFESNVPATSYLDIVHRYRRAPLQNGPAT